MRQAEVDGLERLAIDAFAADDQLHIGEWVVVIGASSARRANAIYPIGDPGCSMSMAISEASRFLKAHDRSVLCKVAAPPGQSHHLEPCLSASGFLREGLTDVLVIDGLAGRADTPVSVVEIDDSPDAWFHDRIRMLRLTGPQHEQLRTSIVGATRPMAFARTTGEGAAQGRAAMLGGWLGIFDMLTEPASRGQGLGRSVLESLLAWGAASGAERAFLQVEVGNEPARALYAGAGFELAYRYSYWRSPE